MKKLLALMLVLSLSIFGFAAFAEEATLTEDEVKIEGLGGIEIPELTARDVESYAVGGYTVTNDNETYTVNTGSLTFKVDVSAYPGVLVLTRDFYASMKGYMSYDYNAVLPIMEENDVHLWIIDQETGNMMIIYTVEGDAFSQQTGSFTTLSAANQALIAQVNTGSADIYTIGNCNWFAPGSEVLATIVGGQYVCIEYGTGDGATEEDLLDVIDILSTMTIE
ncbi:MAG: hypothetical protein IJJ23_02250 [Clostridia bacterium]|nr:hypothetical protein [Clostridia bacterium]